LIDKCYDFLDNNDELDSNIKEEVNFLYDKISANFVAKSPSWRPIAEFADNLGWYKYILSNLQKGNYDLVQKLLPHFNKLKNSAQT